MFESRIGHLFAWRRSTPLRVPSRAIERVRTRVDGTFPRRAEEKALGPSCKTRSGKPTLEDVSVQVSQASRIACIGPNGAGKSTLIKVLVGETKPDEGCPEVYRHQNCRIAYVAQHAFHHIEQHLEMSPVEYIQWRFSGGLDKEQQAMEAAQMSDEEKAQLKQPFIVYLKELAAELDEAGNATGEREIIFEKMEPLKKGQKPPPVDPVNGIFPNCVRTIKQLIGRRTRHGDYEYEVKWGDKEMTSMDPKNNLYVPKVVLETHGFHKLMKAIDDKIAAEAGNVKPLTTTAIQRHLDDFGLHEEFGTYVPRPRPFSQLRGAMDSVSDFESGGCGFESRRSCRRTTIWTDVESEGYGFDSRIGLSRRSPQMLWPSGLDPVKRVTRGAGFRHQSSGVGSNPTNIMAAPSSTDWRNGSASDSSPEGYVFESRIGHS